MDAGLGARRLWIGWRILDAIANRDDLGYSAMDTSSERN